MRNIRNTIELIEYISKPICNNYRNSFYEINDISEKECSKYLKIIQSLSNNIKETYLGDSVMFSRYKELGEYDIERHFDWCWSKTLISNELSLVDDTELKRYFINYFKETFYYEPKENHDKTHDLNHWNRVFDLNVQKTKSELEFLLDLHNIFDKTFLNKL